MQFRLRTLLLIMAFAPPLLAVAWEYRDLRLHPAIWNRHLPVHSCFGIGCLLLYPAAVILQGTVLSQWRDWRRPPRDTRLSRVAFAAAILVGLFCILYLLTDPRV